MHRRFAGVRCGLIVGLCTAMVVSCGGDGDDAATTTAGATSAPTTTATTTTDSPTTSSTSTTRVTTTIATTTTTPTTTRVTTTTTPAPVLPTWSAAVVLAGSRPDSPLVTPGLRPRFAATDVGAVALQPSGRDEADATTRLWFSSDALSWEPTEHVTGQRLWTVAPGGPGFVAVGAADTDEPGLSTPVGVLPRPKPVVWTSVEGRTWSRATVDSTPFEFGEIDDVTATADGLVALGEVWDGDEVRGPAIWRSPDGLSWTLQPGDPLGVEAEPMLMRIATGAGGLVVVGVVTPADAAGPGPIRSWWSADGDTWERTADIDSFSDGSSPAGVVPFGEGFVMVGNRAALAPLVWVSSDGRTWADPMSLPVRSVTDSSIVSGVATDGSVLVAFGDDVVFGADTDPAVADVSIWVSPDASSWEQVPPETLRDESLPAGVGPLGLLHLDGDWILLGAATDDTTGSRVGIAWFGRSPS